MCIAGCSAQENSNSFVLSQYFFITKRMQTMRKFGPTSSVAAEIDGMTIHSFLSEERHSGKTRPNKSGDSKLEREWHLFEYRLIDQKSMVGLTLLAKLNGIIWAAKRDDPQLPFGGVNVFFW